MTPKQNRESLLLVAMFATSCFGQPKQNHSSDSLKRLSACELGRYSDYVGKFEIVAMKTPVDEYGLTQCTLKLIQPLIAQPPNDERTFTSSSPVRLLRDAKVGFELTARLALPADVKVESGSTVIAFLTFSSVHNTWADLNSQGVFWGAAGRWFNTLAYSGERSVSETDLLGEGRRGATLSRAGMPPCETHPAPADGGSQTLDGGR